MIPKHSTKMVPAVTFVLCLVFASQPAVAEDPPGTSSTKTIAEAWSRRQKIAKTVRIVWRQQYTTAGPTGRLAELESRRGKDLSLEGAQSSASPLVTLERVSVLCLDGDRFAYSYDTKGIEQVNKPNARKQFPSHYKVVFTESTYAKYSDMRSSPSIPDTATAIVTIDRPDRCDAPKLPDVRPLVLALRPLTQRLSFIDLSECKVAPARGTIGESSCLILEPKDDTSYPRKSYWVDPARDYLILRAINSVAGQGMLQTDIVYDQDPVLGWVPKSWSVVDLDGAGHLQNSFRSSVGELSLNQPIPVAEFTVEGHDGATVNDVRESDFIRSRDRARRDSAELSPQSSSRLLIVVVGNIVLLSLVVGVVAVRRWKQSK
jgi:hypothetical protein